MIIWYELRYWLFGLGWRTHRQSDVFEHRLTLYLGPLRVDFWRF